MWDVLYNTQITCHFIVAKSRSNVVHRDCVSTFNKFKVNFDQFDYQN